MAIPFWCLCCVLVLLILFAQIRRMWNWVILLVLPIPYLGGVDADGQLDAVLGTICIFVIAWLAVQDVKNKKRDSIFLKYNVFCEGNKVPKWLCLCLLIAAAIVSAIKVVMLMMNKW